MKEAKLLKKKYVFNFLILFIALFNYNILIHAQNATVYKHINVVTLKKSINFLVVGDWGHNGYYHQRNVAAQMNIAAKEMNIDFIVSAGDNFYPDGVESVDDPYFISSFENVYTGPELFVPWYVVLGNHDYVGNPQVEVDYTKRSRRWEMPSRYYSFERKFDDGEKSLFVFLDTSPFIKAYYTEEKYKNVIGQDTTAQYNWLKNLLSSSTDRWKLVFGHHHFYTAEGKSEELKDLRETFGPLFQKYKVDAYICGHQHSLQYIEKKNVYTRFIISGAGSETEKVYPGEAKFASSTSGFTAISLDPNSMLIQMVDYKGNVIFKTRLNK
jgi:tartrate-resistant acid phosphatase type 5